MAEVGIETLKEHLGDYLKRARNGERIVITEHGCSVALLTSIEGNALAGRAWELVETGAANWSGGKPVGVEPKAASPRKERVGHRPGRPSLILYLDTSSLINLC